MLGRGVATSSGPLSLTPISTAIRPGCVLELDATGRWCRGRVGKHRQINVFFKPLSCMTNRGRSFEDMTVFDHGHLPVVERQPMLLESCSGDRMVLAKLSRVMTIRESGAGTPASRPLETGLFGPQSSKKG